MVNKTLKRKLKFLFRGVSSYVIFRVLHRSGFDLSRTIVITGCTRSGSTWLAELISSIDGHVQLFEPLNGQYVKEVREAGIDRNAFMEPSNAWPEGRKLFEAMLTAKLVNPWILSQVSPGRAIGAKRLVVKYVRANLLVGWMSKNLPILKPALVIRHPCGVISSQMAKGWTPCLKELLSNEYFDRLPDVREKCRTLKTEEELGAVAWCLRYHVPLKSEDQSAFVLVTYEALVRDSKTELEKLFSAWELPLTPDILARIEKPSDTVTGASEVVSGRDPLAGWKSKFSQDQVDRIFKVLNWFGMDFYSQELEPDIDKLNAFRGLS